MTHSPTSAFGQARSHVTGGGLSGSKAAKPIVAFIFPVAAGAIIEYDKPDHVLRIFEAELGRNAHADGKAVFRRQDLSIVLEGSAASADAAPWPYRWNWNSPSFRPGPKWRAKHVLGTGSNV
jgi:hypothetical protein